jgi:hypothetical protein
MAGENRRTERRTTRASLGALAVLSLGDVVALLPGREAHWRAWVPANVAPVGPGLDLYVWEDVVAALRVSSGALKAAVDAAPVKPRASRRGTEPAPRRVSVG